MLRNLDPLLSPDLLHALAAMGHGDRIVIADANFPGSGLGPACLRADGIGAGEILRAVLSVLPLDTFEADAAVTMEVVGQADAVPPAVTEFAEIIAACADAPPVMSTLSRQAFYDLARTAFAIVQTGETRLYGNIILTKGVVTPET